MKLTKKKAIELHRELWDWLYHNPSKDKTDWPRWRGNGGDLLYVYNLCFLCESSTFCCLLDWSPTYSCMTHNSWYKKYLYAKSSKTRKKYAKIIRDLPKA